MAASTIGWGARGGRFHDACDQLHLHHQECNYCNHKICADVDMGKSTDPGYDEACHNDTVIVRGTSSTMRYHGNSSLP